MKNIVKASFFKRDHGYSLIEMAIVLAIIGVVVGGVLKGQELIESARLKKVVAQINDIHLAVQSFKDRYNGELPGDFAHASTQINKKLRDGDGDHMVSGDGLAQDSEALIFWSHLSGANLMGGISSSDPVFGKGAPSSAMGGGFTVASDPLGLKGLWLILGNAKNTQGTGALLTPAQAQQIDQKLDDGNPLTGKVRVMEVAGISEGQCITSEIFNLETTTPACIVLIQLQ